MAMAITKQTDDSKCTLKLDGDMTIYSAMENKIHFEPYFDSEQDVLLDMSAVNEFDSTGFQMLLLFERQTKEHDKAFNVKPASPVVEEVLMLYKKQNWLN